MQQTPFVLGLDWDGTLSDYGAAFARIAALGTQVVIITLNDDITLEAATRQLALPADQIRVCVCPEERLEDYAHWKVEQCLRHQVSVMFDDDPHVVDRCLSAGVAAVGVREDARRFTRGFEPDR